MHMPKTTLNKNKVLAADEPRLALEQVRVTTNITLEDLDVDEKK